MEFGRFFELSLRVSKLIGLDLIEDFHKSRIRSFGAKLFFWLLMTGLLVVALSLGVSGYINFHELSKASSAIANSILLFTAFGKSAAIFFKRNSIIKLMNELKAENCTSVTNDVRDKNEKAFRGFNNYQRIFAFLLVGGGFLSGSTPIVQFLINGFWDYKLPYPMWLPFNFTSTGSFLSTYFILELQSLSTKGFLISNDVVLNGLIVVLSLKFDVLASDLEDFDFPSGYEGVKKLVDRHCKLLEISQELDEIFSGVNFITFMGSSLLLCFPAFMIVSSNESLTVLQFAVFFIAALLQIFVLSFYVQKLKSTSLKIAAKTFEFDWYNCKDKRVKMAMLMILLRAQKPVKVTALKFTEISIDTFSTVIQLKIFLSETNFDFFAYRFSPNPTRIWHF